MIRFQSFYEHYHDEMQKNLRVWWSIAKHSKKMKNLDIFMKKTIVIITLNNFDFEFEIYLIIVNDKTRNDKKLFVFEDLIKILQKKKLRLNSAEINFNKASISIKKFDREEREKSSNNKNTDRNNRDDERNDNRSSDFNINFTFVFHLSCDNNHSFDDCFDKNIVCRNFQCDKKRHKQRNCIWFEKSKHEKWKKIKKKKKKNKKIIKDITFFIHVDHVYLDMIKISINEIYFTHVYVYIWVMNFDVTYHCSNNRNLFLKILKKVNDKTHTTNEKVLKIEKLDDVLISLSNDNFLKLIDVMYIFIFMINFINIFKLHQKNWNINYFENQSISFYESDDDFVVNANMIDNLFVFRTINNKINATIQFVVTQFVVFAMFVNETQIYAFAKFIFDLNIWHRRLTHFDYRNVIANVSKIKDMKNVKKSVFDKICELCMKKRQQIEISRISVFKFTIFLKKINVDIKSSLSIIAKNNKIFVFIKDYVTNLMFWYVCKFKSEFYKIVINFVT